MQSSTRPGGTSEVATICKCFDPRLAKSFSSILQAGEQLDDDTISRYLSRWARNHTGWSANDKDKAFRVLQSLKAKLLEINPKDYSDTEKTLNATLTNPPEFASLVKNILYGEPDIHHKTYKIFSPNDCKSKPAIKRLGINHQKRYLMVDILKVIDSPDFNASHTCSSIPNNTVIEMDLHLSSTEITKHVVEVYLDLLISQVIQAGVLIPNFILATMNKNTAATKVISKCGNNTHTTYLKGKVDYGIVALTSQDDSGLSSDKFDRDNTAISRFIGEMEHYKNAKETFPNLKSYVGDVIDHLESSKVRYEVVFVGVKNPAPAEAGRTDVPPITHCHALYKMLAMCRGVEAYGIPNVQPDDQCIKFVLSDGVYWCFGIMDNGTDTAHYTTFLNNSNEDKTSKIFTLLMLWTCLRGQTIRDELFANCDAVTINL